MYDIGQSNDIKLMDFQVPQLKCIPSVSVDRVSLGEWSKLALQELVYEAAMHSSR